MTQWWKRYEPILEARPQPVQTVLVQEMGKALCDLCEAFPPARDEVAFADDKSAARFGPRLSDMPRCDLGFVETVCDILRLELEHDVLGLADYLNHDRYRTGCPTEDHVEALFFLWPILLELLFSWKESVKTGLKQRDLIAVVDAFAARFKKRRMLLM